MTNTNNPDPATYSIRCDKCDFTWTAPNTPRGMLYLENTGAGHTVLYPDHATYLVHAGGPHG